MEGRKKWRKRRRTAGAILLCLLLSGCYGLENEGIEVEIPSHGEMERESLSTEPVEDHEEELSEQEELNQPAKELEEGTGKEIRVLSDLKMDGRLLDEQFCMAGDMGKTMTAYVVTDEERDVFLADRIALIFQLERGQDAGENGPGEITVSGMTEIAAAKGQKEYSVPMKIEKYWNGETLESWTEEVRIAFQMTDSGIAQVTVESQEGTGMAAGDYFPASTWGEPFDLSSRYVAEGELADLPSEDLRLLRNGLYAAYGRKFTDPVLASYFERQIWYRGWVEPEDFSDQVFSSVQRANLELIQKLEQISWDERSQEGFLGLDEEEPAPYLDYLDQNRETGLQADLTRAEDQGTYWSVPGILSLPVVMTRNQWEAAARGEAAELCVNELTGELWVLEYYPGYGYAFYEKGTVPDLKYQAWDIQIHYNYAEGYYELEQASDDTIMKPVYQGELRFAKGAVYGGHVGLLWASQLQQEIPFSQPEKLKELNGNYLVHNGKGYFQVVYYLGD